MNENQELPRGTLDLMILNVLSLEPMHGWGIIQRIHQLSGDVFQVNQGAVYPALQRLKKKGLIKPEWRTTEHRRRARYYTLTRTGEKKLQEERAAWEISAAAVARVLEAGT